MKLHKALSLFLSLVLTLSLCVPAYAADSNTPTIDDILTDYTDEERLIDAYAGVIDPGISQEILDSICVGITGSTGARSAESDYDITYSVRNLGQTSSGDVYAVTAAQKTKNGSNTVHGVDAWLSVVWVDHFGTQNELKAVSGGWDPHGIELSNRSVEMRVIDGTESLARFCSPTTNTFSYPGFTDWFGLTIKAESSAVFRHDGTTARIYVTVSPTIFD